MDRGRFSRSRVAVAARRGGFTLIECLIASIVLVFITTAVVYSLTASRNNQVFIEEQQAQLALCEALMAKLAAMRYDGPDNTPAPGTLDAMDGYEDSVTGDGGDAADASIHQHIYTRRVEVESLAAFSGNSGKAAVVTVTITGPGGRALVRRRVLPVTR